MATHSSVLAWRISGTGEPGGLQSMGSHRVGHDWSDLAAAAGDVWQKPWSSGAGTRVGCSSPWVRLGSQYRARPQPFSCAWRRLSPLMGQKVCPSSHSQRWWQDQGVLLEQEVVRVRDPSLLLDTLLSFTPEFSLSSLLPPKSCFRAIHVPQSPPPRSALFPDPACHRLSEYFLGYCSDLLPGLPPLLWPSSLLLHSAAKMSF